MMNRADYMSTRNQYIELSSQSISLYDKTIISLSSGGFIMVSALLNYYPETAIYKPLLLLAWVLLGWNVFLVVSSFYFSCVSHEQGVLELDSKQTNDDASRYHERSAKLNQKIKRINA